MEAGYTTAPPSNFLESTMPRIAPRYWRSIFARIALSLLWLQLPDLLPAAESPDASVVIFPARFTLSGPEAIQRLAVAQQVDGRIRGPAQVDQWTSSNPNVVTVEDGLALPVADGIAELTAATPQGTVTAKVNVVGTGEVFTWSFRNHVQSVLTKAGCNSGACHGAQAGKAGFRLSLRGFDSTGDFAAITRHARGRRIVPSDPGRSLLLTKPTGAVAHGGGMRLDVGSRSYQAVAGWIAAGTPSPADNDPRLDHLEVFPQQAVLKPGDEQRLIVVAHFSDGHTEDVTAWAKFTSANLTVAEVAEDGLVQVVGQGEGAITVWYLSQVALAGVTVPFDAKLDPQMFAKAPRHNFIDTHVLAKLQDLNIPPSPLASDGEFLRRAMLDTIGRLPTATEAREFIASTNPDKRTQLIDQLFQRSELVDYWTYKWSDVLLVSSDKLKPAAMWSYNRWVRDNVAANTPWDEMARELVTAKGSTLEQGATNFFVLHDDPLDLAETTSQAFLGLSIGCAKCHNHPLEKWTNRQYFAMANLFARVRAKEAAGDGNKTIFDASSGDVIQPLTGVAQPPQPLDGQVLAPGAAKNRREHLADWLTSPQNRFFAKAVTNRVWANFMNVGLVESVDDLRLSNPASNAPLLDALADYLVEKDFDLQALMRLILQSATYQRSSQVVPGNEADTRFYARFYPERLMAEVLLDAMSQVTQSPTKFGNYPSGWRAMQLPDVAVDNYFLKTFGRPERVITCECERTSQPSMVQVLHISNGSTLNEKIAAAGNQIDTHLTSKQTVEEIIEELYLAALARLPKESERKQLLALLNGEKPQGGAEEQLRREQIEDLYWSVLSSKEFLFNR